VSAKDLASLLPLILIAAVFFLLVLRPARVRQRATLALQSQLSVGQEVMTTSGLFGTIVELTDKVAVLETAPGVRSRWIRAAIDRVVTPEDLMSGSGAQTVDRTDLSERPDPSG
jgi:preprotein translocase subunit YajC